MHKLFGRKTMMLVTICLVSALLVAGLFSRNVSAQTTGPGLTKITFTAAELFKPIFTLQTTTTSGEPRGNGLVTMHKGYLAVLYGRDSGASGGGFAFYNISNPRAPVLVSKRDVPELREAHGFARSSSYPGDYAVLQAGTGIQFWDWTNVNNPVLLNHMTLPGVQFSDYGVGAWWLAWQAPYVFVGGSANGLFIVDATNPSSPTLIKQVPISQTGGFRIHPVFPIGNILIATSADFGGADTGIVALDISDPTNPVVIRSQTTGIPVLYSSFFNGNKLIGLGNFDHNIYVWDMSNPAQGFPLINSIGGMDRPVYATVQDGFALVGDETSFTKIDIRTGTFSIVGKGTSGLGDRSEDIVTPLGNIAFVANDHGTGSAIIPHQLAPDNTGPSVNMVNPPNNATNQKLSSRVGITMSDWLDLASINQTTFIVRPLGGSALAGKYSTEQGIVNFSPNAPFLPNTTYEVVIPVNGIKDFSGNGVPTAFTSRFTTGGPNPPPTVQARVNAPAQVNQSVAFSITSSSGSGTLTYSWDFGDGSAVTPFSTTSTASHTYASAGHFPAKVTISNGTLQSSSSFTQTIHHPVTSTKPTASSTIILDSVRNRVWTVNPDTDTITAINAANNTKFLEKPVGKNPRTLAQAPDGTIWVVNQQDANISVIDRDSGNVIQTITLTPGSQPYGIVFSPDGAAAYVSTQGTGQLLKLSPSSRAITNTLSLNFPLRGLAVSSNSSRVFVTRFISPVNQGEVVEVSASSFTITRTFSMALDPGPDGNVAGRGVPNYLSALAISPDGRQARVPSKKDNTSRGQFRDGLALTFESTVRTIVSQLDLLNNTAPIAARIDFNDRDMANAVVFSTLGDYVFVATQGTNTVEVLDAYDNRLMTSLPDVGLAPQGLVLSADGKRLYVQNFMGRSISVYDVSGIVDSTTNTFQNLATIATVATEKLSAQVLQGKRIFYNADDPRMNLDSYISCATCHLDGGSDERVWDFTDRGEGFRNTINLRGKRGVGQGRVHWTANFDEIQDFEHDIRGPFGGLGFMSDANFNSGGRNTALGSPKAGFSAELDALAAYVTSLNVADPSPYRNADGSLTSAGQSGKTLFTTSCASCHSGPDFTDSSSGVLHNVGTIKPSSGKRIGQTLTGFDTPSLKGIWNSAPYLHDGSALTLRDVLTTANPSGTHANVSSLSSAQIDQIVAYLQQIDERETGGPPVPTSTPTTGPSPTRTTTPTAGAVTRVRFFPRSTFSNRMTGGIFQGSNTSATAGFVNLVTITTQPTEGTWSELTFSNITTYRYLRYLAPTGGFGNVAEIEFYSGATRLTGTGFGTAGAWNNGTTTFDKALDGNTTTFFDAATGDGIYVGIDTGSTGPTSTPTRTPTIGASNTPLVTFTTTRTPTPGTPPNTPTRTLTPTFGISPTATVTPTRTSTPTTGPSLTPTPTSSGVCTPTSTITIPFTFDGAGNFCWQSSSLGGFINSWNTTNVTVNGMNVTNIWVGSGSYPAKINGFYYVSYSSSVTFGHFEAKP